MIRNKNGTKKRNGNVPVIVVPAAGGRLALAVRVAVLARGALGVGGALGAVEGDALAVLALRARGALAIVVAARGGGVRDAPVAFEVAARGARGGLLHALAVACVCVWGWAGA